MQTFSASFEYFKTKHFVKDLHDNERYESWLWNILVKSCGHFLGCYKLIYAQIDGRFAVQSCPYPTQILKCIFKNYGQV